MPLLHGGENHIMDSLCSQGRCAYPSIHKSYFIEEREWEREKETNHKGKEKKNEKIEGSFKQNRVHDSREGR